MKPKNKKNVCLELKNFEMLGYRDIYTKHIFLDLDEFC